jgi:hypothetical protein
MPLPRSPRPKRRLGGSRSTRRRAHTKTWLTAKITERFIALAAQLERRREHTYRGAYGVIVYLKEGDPVPPGLQKVEFDANGNEMDFPAHEKAPGLAAEGFSSCFREKEG